MIEKVNIEGKYKKEEEQRNDYSPYQAYYECVKETFGMDNIKTFLDAGCANGALIYLIKSDNENIEVQGVEYFPWQKDYAKDLIKNNILTFDMRDDLVLNKKYDIVNCTELGEHIEPEYADMLMSNLKNLCGGYLIISWAESGGVNDRQHDKNLQHLNPLKVDKVEQLLKSHNFIKNEELTNKFLSESNKRPNFRFWWRKSLGVWEIKKG